jgi:trehalose/maltose hydrolase-like predicted phosphorylase
MTAAAPSPRRDARAALPAALDRRFEAVVFVWEGTAVSDPRADASGVRRALEGICALGMDAYVVTAADVGNVDSQLAARPRGPGRLYLCVNRGSEVFLAGERGVELAARRRQEEARVTGVAKHVEIGRRDDAEAGRWVFADLWRRGVSPALVLVAGDEHGSLGGLPADSLLVGSEYPGPTVVSVGPEPTGVPSGVVHLGGGPDAFLALLEDQLERRERRDVPEIADDEGWTVAVDGLDPELERVHEALLTLADGRIGTNGSPAWSHPLATPRVLAAGVYDGEGPATELLAAPCWQVLASALPDGARLRRRLDLRSGLLRQTLVAAEGEAAALRFSSLARPGTVALRAAGPPAVVSGGGSLRAAQGTSAEQGRTDEATFMLVPASSGGVAATASEVVTDGRVERLGAYVSAAETVPDAETAVAALADARRAGFEVLLGEHRAAWAQRWEDADVVVSGDQELQLAVRFALFHLMTAVASSGEAAVGARGLAGPGYRGHVFWDTDVFVLPFLAATHPPAARAILEYRIRRLPAAMHAAGALGLAGARFAWESARDGVDVTPPSARDASGRIIRIRTGESEEHVVADVAWAASCYLDWTGDEEFAAGPGLRLLVETARYWASRVRFDREGRAHLYGVIGPDEYHEPVDDNAYTNVMARWNLRRAAEAAARYGGVADGERERWLDTAAALVDGYDESNGLYEEFAGFYGLEPLVVADLAPRRPIAADLLLGHERVRGAQVVKQADVLMLHHLVPDEVKPGSLEANLAFYEPRTAHGSSLSPAIHASLFARAGRLGRAVQMLRIAGAIDLEDLTGTTASGLHLATMGGLWQALAFGFAGLRPRGETLVVDPRLPDGWDELELRVRFRGARGRVRIRHEGVTVEGDHGLRWEEARQ